MELGRVNPQNQQEPFCMTVLALKLSRAANGVSELHGRVSRHMWQCLYPGKTVEQVPIGHITNGIHLLGWMKGPVRRFWRRKLTASSRQADRIWIAADGLGERNQFAGILAAHGGSRILFRTKKSGRCATSCAAS